MLNVSVDLSLSNGIIKYTSLLKTIYNQYIQFNHTKIKFKNPGVDSIEAFTTWSHSLDGNSLALERIGTLGSGDDQFRNLTYTIFKNVATIEWYFWNINVYPKYHIIPLYDILLMSHLLAGVLKLYYVFLSF